MCAQQYDAIHARVNQTIGALQSGNYSVADLQSLRNDMRSLGYDDTAIQQAIDPYASSLSQRLNDNDANFQALNDFVDRLATKPTEVLEGWFVDAPEGIYNTFRHPVDSYNKAVDLVAAYIVDPKAVSDAIIEQAKDPRALGAMIGGLAWGAALGKVPGALGKLPSIIARAGAAEGAAATATAEAAALDGAAANAAAANAGAASTAAADASAAAPMDPDALSAAQAIEKYLGEGYTIEPSPTSDLALRSQDGLRSVRFDLTDPHGLEPHINVEAWKPRARFPGDERMINTVNKHAFVK